MRSSICAARDPKQYLSWNTWGCRFLEPTMGESIKDRLADSLKILVRVDRRQGLVQLRIGQVMRFYMPFIRVI